MYKLEIEDYSRLGGPMGTEVTPLIGTYYFNHTQSILPWLKKRFPKTTFPPRLALNRGYDCRAIGIKMSKYYPPRAED